MRKKWLYYQILSNRCEICRTCTDEIKGMSGRVSWDLYGVDPEGGSDIQLLGKLLSKIRYKDSLKNSLGNAHCHVTTPTWEIKEDCIIYNCNIIFLNYKFIFPNFGIETVDLAFSAALLRSIPMSLSARPFLTKSPSRALPPTLPIVPLSSYLWQRKGKQVKKPHSY